MKKTASLFLLIGMSAFILASVLSQTSIDLAFAQGDKHFISSTAMDGIWILNKSNGKMLYLQFEKQAKTFRSESINFPSNFNLNKCQMQAFGNHGKAVFIVDVSSGLATVYVAKRDRTIESGINFHYDKGVMFSGKSKNFWILDTTNRELIFIRFKSGTKIKESPPIHIPSNFNLENSYMKSVGTQGEGVFLFDTSTGDTTFYKVKVMDDDSYSIKEHMNVDVKNYLTTN